MYFFDSPAYSEFCRRVHGIDLKQMSIVTMCELELFFKEIQLLRGSKILDLGCSTGHFSDYISKRYCSHVTGIDINKNSIDYAKMKFRSISNLDFQEMDFNDLKFDSFSFDLIYSFDTLYFTGTVEKLYNLLDNCMDLLKPGGKLAVFWVTFPSNDNDNCISNTMSEPNARYTPVGMWGTRNKVKCQAYDLTAKVRLFYPNALKEFYNLRSQLEEEIPQRLNLRLAQNVVQKGMQVVYTAGSIFLKNLNYIYCNEKRLI